MMNSAAMAPDAALSAVVLRSIHEGGGYSGGCGVNGGVDGNGSGRAGSDTIASCVGGEGVIGKIDGSRGDGRYLDSTM